MKNIFIIPVLFALLLFALAIFIRENAIVAEALGGAAVLSGIASAFIAKGNFAKELKTLAGRAIALQNERSASFSVKFSPAGKQVAEALLALAQARDAAVIRAAEAGQEAQQYRRELEGELEREEANALEQKNIRLSLSAASDKSRSATAGLAGEIRSLSQMVADIGNGMEEQKFSIRKTSAAMEQITGSIDDVSQSVINASDNAQGSRAKTQTGHAEVRGAGEVMHSVKDSITNLKNTMNLLGEQSENIGSVMKVINEVADQTNLLALNAAIEAARAGEAGRGFAVVADEVRKLAEKTMQATGEIGGLVREIQTAAQENIKAVESVSASVISGSGQLDRAGALMDEIARSMDDTADELQNISGAITEQTASSHDTHQAIHSMSRVIGNSAVHMQNFTTRLVAITQSLEELDLVDVLLESGGKSTLAAPRRLVEWTHDLNTGIEIIDSQHKMLCYYINALYRTSLGSDSSSIADIVGYLKLYTATHFSTEEQYFANSSYPETVAHKKIHVKFVEKVSQVQADLQAGRISVSDDLLKFLKDWLLNHIRITDHQYVPFVKSRMGLDKTS